MTTKEELHHLIDELPPSDLYAAKRFLTYLVITSRALPRFLAEAPIDDEPETEEERAAVAEAYEDLAAGRVVSLDDVKRELGL